LLPGGRHQPRTDSASRVGTDTVTSVLRTTVREELEVGRVNAATVVNRATSSTCPLGVLRNPGLAEMFLGRTAPATPETTARTGSAVCWDVAALICPPRGDAVIGVEATRTPARRTAVSSQWPVPR
jgi:hypothetical protein